MDHQSSGGGEGPIRLLLSADEVRVRAAVQDLLEKGSAVVVSLAWADENRRRPGTYVRRLPVRQAGGVILYLPVEQIDWIEATDQYVRLHCGDRRYLARESMSHLESRLDPTRFRRIHRSTIVNLDRVRELHLTSQTHRWAVLANGGRLRVSQVHWPGLQEALMGLD